MLVSWNWLKQYVPLDMPLEELQRRLTLSGLNHEGTAEVAGDMAIDLEVTSNRPDCLGHIGIAREVAVLWNHALTIPAANPRESKTPVDSLVSVRIECPDLCLRYTARAIRGVKIGPSPQWMARRLETVGLTPINNVVDISNYVLMECGQPLHTFDFGKLGNKGDRSNLPHSGPSGAAHKLDLSPLFPREIVVRRPLLGETTEAIDHKTYQLGPEMCMICDGKAPVAIGGVMGGAQTEISPDTRDVLIEAAEFDPVSIRNTARLLNLHSDSSYRFERRVDPEGLDWASRRCCELILDLAGGELARGIVDVGRPPRKREPIVLRFSQLQRILGIEVPAERVREILISLGNVEETGKQGLGIGDWGLDSGIGVQGSGESGGCEAASGKSHISNQQLSNPQSLIPNPSLTMVPPSWRRDLTREIDLIEEVGRIHGYDAIPEDVGVPMVPSARRREDRVLEKVRHVLTACGFDEAVTLSAVDRHTSESLSPWTDAEPLRSALPVVRGADRLRRSLLPSLLAARRANEALANPIIELFEIAKAYLPQGAELPREPLLLGIAGGRDYPAVKGVVEAILRELKIAEPVEAEEAGIAQLDTAASCRLRFRGQTLGYVGRLTDDALKQFDLRGPATVAEVRLAPLIEAADLMPRCVEQSSYPAVTRDLNLVVAESVRWADVAATARREAGPCLETLQYRDTYRDEKRLGVDRKSLLFSIVLRSGECTFTNQQADEIRERIVAACRSEHGAELRT
ncbi:MAG: phenylalanine--tRNA ligase subunit beta [Planctomycetes bacterium]|nr:phenylalanine--tRNA ligase subunit beta [Planctomycetota bacterium]MCG2685715.1 phenylalanine--tRNA ligase subunit beta [Planctomycetales bacterium]